MFTLLEKQFHCQNYVCTGGKIVLTGKKIVHKKYVFPLMRNLFLLLGKTDFTDKKYVSTSRNYVCITKKYSCTVQTTCFHQEKIYFHFWKKTAFYRRLYVSTNRKYVSTTGKTVFTDKKCVFPLVGIMLALLKKQLHDENYVFPIA